MQKWLKPLRKNIAEQIQAIWDFTAGLKALINNIKAVPTDGIIIENSTVSTGGEPVQMSPRIRFRCHVLDTDGAGTDDYWDWAIEVLPTSGADTYSGIRVGYSKNGGAYTYITSYSTGNTLFNNLIANYLETSGDIVTSAGKLVIKNLNTGSSSQSVLDDATITLPTGARGFLRVNDDADFGKFFVSTSGGVTTVTYEELSTNCDDADTDTMLCVYASGNNAIIKNRKGSAKVINYTFEYV